MGFKSLVFEWGYSISDFGVERAIFCNKRCRDSFKAYTSYWKAEYYLYCRFVEESVPSDLTKLTVKVKELKSELQQVIKHNEVETSDNTKLIKDELNAWENMYIQLRIG